MHDMLDLNRMQAMIEKRKSVRQYAPGPLGTATTERLLAALDHFTCLTPGTRIGWKMVPRDRVKTTIPLRWLPEQLLAFYVESYAPDLETSAQHLAEVGFIGQQLDLWLQTQGLGACWLGMGRMKDAEDEVLFPAKAPDDPLSFAMLMAIGQPAGGGQRTTLNDFKRKSLGDIADRLDPRLEPARLAPSAVNSQPWYFTHDADGKTLHVWCVRGGLLWTAPLAMNLVDMGIVLAHLYVANPGSFRFFKVPDHGSVKNGRYIGSVTL